VEKRCLDQVGASGTEALQGGIERRVSWRSSPSVWPRPAQEAAHHPLWYQAAQKQGEITQPGHHLLRFGRMVSSQNEVHFSHLQCKARGHHMDRPHIQVVGYGWVAGCWTGSTRRCRIAAVRCRGGPYPVTRRRPQPDQGAPSGHEGRRGDHSGVADDHGQRVLHQTRLRSAAPIGGPCGTARLGRVQARLSSLSDPDAACSCTIT
jgi:hypothetical protein